MRRFRKGLQHYSLVAWGLFVGQGIVMFQGTSAKHKPADMATPASTHNAGAQICKGQ